MMQDHTEKVNTFFSTEDMKANTQNLKLSIKRITVIMAG